MIDREEPRSGVWFGPYQTMREIGRGGFGRVFMAQDRHGAKVALKVLEAMTGNSMSGRGRFPRELAAAQRVASPHVARVIDSDLNSDPPWIAYQFISGETLKEKLYGGPLPSEQAVDALLALAQGLAAVHAAGLVHRDVTPDNVIVDGQGKGVLIDLGIAALGEAGDLTREQVGKVAFQAPEQWRGSTITPAVDIWQFGVCLVKAISGHLPFPSGAHGVMYNAITQNEPDLSGMPTPLRLLAMKCLTKGVDERPSARGLVDFLQQARIETPAVERKHLLAVTGIAAADYYSGYPRMADDEYDLRIARLNELEIANPDLRDWRSRSGKPPSLHPKLAVMRLVAVEPQVKYGPVMMRPKLEAVPPFQPFDAERVMGVDQRALRDGRILLGDVVAVLPLPPRRWTGVVVPRPLAGWRDGTEAPARLPLTCPSCGTPLADLVPHVRFLGFVRLLHRCPNSAACPEQVIFRLAYLADEQSLGLTTLRGSAARELVESGVLPNEADLFHLTSRDILGVPGFFEEASASDLDLPTRSRRVPSEMASRLLEELESARAAPLERHLVALGIVPRHHSDWATNLSRDLVTLRAIYDASEANTIADPRVARAVERWFRGPDSDWHLRILDRWSEDGVQLGW